MQATLETHEDSPGSAYKKVPPHIQVEKSEWFYSEDRNI
jgi:hypothetical protein